MIVSWLSPDQFLTYSKKLILRSQFGELSPMSSQKMNDHWTQQIWRTLGGPLTDSQLILKDLLINPDGSPTEPRRTPTDPVGPPMAPPDPPWTQDGPPMDPRQTPDHRCIENMNLNVTRLMQKLLLPLLQKVIQLTFMKCRVYYEKSKIFWLNIVISTYIFILRITFSKKQIPWSIHSINCYEWL